MEICNRSITSARFLNSFDFRKLLSLDSGLNVILNLRYHSFRFKYLCLVGNCDYQLIR